VRLRGCHQHSRLPLREVSVAKHNASRLFGESLSIFETVVSQLQKPYSAVTNYQLSDTRYINLDWHG
jgi:hypothetical protein